MFGTRTCHKRSNNSPVYALVSSYKGQLMQVVWPWGGTLLLDTQLTMECDLVNRVVCIVFGSKWMNHFWLTLNKKLLSFWQINIKLPSEFTNNYKLFMVKILQTWVLCIIGWENQGTLVVICNWISSHGLEGQLPQLTIWTVKLRLIQENWQISQTAISEMLTCLACVIEIYACLG